MGRKIFRKIRLLYDLGGIIISINVNRLKHLLNKLKINTNLSSGRYSLIGKTLVFKINVVGSSPTTFEYTHSSVGRAFV